MAKEPSEPSSQARIHFHFVKSADFRVIHVDGAHGGITPHGYIQMTMYAERTPIPQRTTHSVSAEGKLGQEITDERLSRDGAIRECEVTALMDLKTAAALRKWLDEKIRDLQEIQTQRSKEK